MTKFWYLLLIPLFMGLAACGDDDDDEGGVGDSGNLIGLWELSHVKGTVSEGSDTMSFDYDVNSSSQQRLEDDDDLMDYVRYEFLSGNVFKAYSYHGGTWELDGTASYKLNGSKLTMTDGRNTTDFKVKSLTSSTLVLYGEKTETEEGYTYTLKVDMTFKKVK